VIRTIVFAIIALFAIAAWGADEAAQSRNAVLVEAHPAELAQGDFAAANEWLSPCPISAQNLPRIPERRT
jgi:hypothetical protein